MRYCLFLAFLFFTGCATPDKLVSPADEEMARIKREACDSHPELQEQWGECNVRKKISEKLPAIKSCYDKELKKDDVLHGDLMLKIRVRPNGKVRFVTIQEGSLKNKLISNCLISEIRRIQFAAPPAKQDPVIFFPFTLDQVK